MPRKPCLVRGDAVPPLRQVPPLNRPIACSPITRSARAEPWSRSRAAGSFPMAAGPRRRRPGPPRVAANRPVARTGGAGTAGAANRSWANRGWRRSSGAVSPRTRRTRGRERWRRAGGAPAAAGAVQCLLHGRVFPCDHLEVAAGRWSSAAVALSPRNRAAVQQDDAQRRSPSRRSRRAARTAPATLFDHAEK